MEIFNILFKTVLRLNNLVRNILVEHLHENVIIMINLLSRNTWKELRTQHKNNLINFFIRLMCLHPGHSYPMN